jgi:hypothetical protein
MSDIEILKRNKNRQLIVRVEYLSESRRTFMPSSEKQGGTAELSSSASLRSTGNFSTADIGISPL